MVHKVEYVRTSIPSKIIVYPKEYFADQQFMRARVNFKNKREVSKYRKMLRNRGFKRKR